MFLTWADGCTVVDGALCALALALVWTLQRELPSFLFVTSADGYTVVDSALCTLVLAAAFLRSTEGSIEGDPKPYPAPP